ncbi:DUF305 domain-containing protein [Mycobacterium sp. DL592]|uniref:DUF305 domain-containing protein n=1 Tax=Mycobacterium sp. DL592 TaxID=2675524 RepID=UPI0014241699|nr:DUF305 domain-containing protein [Mycobacterium sp. DL592]
MRSTSTRIAAGIAAIAAVVAVASCSKAENHSEHTSTSAAATAASDQVAVHNDHDVMFAQMMIPHHQQAVQLAAMVPDRSTNPELVKLAATISGEQQPEINAMKALLVQWDISPNAAADHSDMPMDGMVDDATMAKLGTLKGQEFDTLWLQSMISHHQGAIAMAGGEVAAGKSPDMITMAQNIVTAQQAEIDQMKKMLGG